MRAIRWACAAIVCLSAPAAAQTPDLEQEADGDEQAQEPASGAVDPDSIADIPTGETIEIVGAAPLAPAQGSAEQLSRDEIDALPGGRGDAFETVRSLPGVAFAPVFDGAGDLAIRGTRGADSFALPPQPDRAGGAGRAGRRLAHRRGARRSRRGDMADRVARRRVATAAAFFCRAARLPVRLAGGQWI